MLASVGILSSDSSMCDGATEADIKSPEHALVKP